MAKKKAQPRYTLIIQWSDEDGCYIVSLPEWGQFASTHGRTIAEAAKHAAEVLELLLDGEASPPKPKLFSYPGADVVNVEDSPRTRAHQQPRRRTA
jgi:antitoxin HicB